MSKTAVAHLVQSDPKLAQVIAAVGPCRFAARREGTHFDAVVRAIVYQQLSGKAAATIHGRILGIYGGRNPTPAELAVTADDTLRAVGLSRQKLGYLKDLASRVDSGALEIERLSERADDEVMDALVQVKGVGKWTAQMFLIFRLGRPDVLPELDLGIRKGVQRAYAMRSLPTPARVLKVGAKWAPYRTIASWYLWRSLD